MARKKQSVRRTAETLERDLTAAEQDLQRPGERDSIKPLLNPRHIITMPELFQPRTFSAGLRELDAGYVKKLKRRIRAEGEIDPPTVVKIKGKWVCVDGHHRIEAYTALNWPKDIVCNWFEGSAREAVDLATRENKKIKLEMREHDKYEQAWQRELIGGWSKRELVEITGVSEGMVAEMRRVRREFEAKDKRGEQLRKAIGHKPLTTISWSEARAHAHNLSPKDWDEQEAAAKLARQITKRFGHKLSENIRVTARALQMHDPELPEALIPQLQQVVVKEQDDTTALRHRPEQALAVEVGELRKHNTHIAERIETIEGELVRRKETGETNSDRTWEKWVRTAKDDREEDERLNTGKD